jgi:hypothetical protein
MGTKFNLTLDLSDHEHRDNPMAQRQIVVHLLQQASQAIGSGYVDPRVKTRKDGVTEDHHSVVHAWGEITTPAVGVVREAVVGSWEFIDGPWAP